MTEDDAKDWLASHFSDDSYAKLARFAEMLRAESARQSLIARSTLDTIWSRHVVDSAQLILLAKHHDGLWLDVGSGGGLPGIIVAILRNQPVLLSEPRQKRAAFLRYVIAELRITQADVTAQKVQDIDQICAVLSARAVAPIDDILRWSGAAVSRETLLLFPRGKTWRSELAIVKHAWQGAFHVEQSITDPASGIIVAQAVTAR